MRKKIKVFNTFNGKICGKLRFTDCKIDFLSKNKQSVNLIIKFLFCQNLQSLLLKRKIRV